MIRLVDQVLEDMEGDVLPEGQEVFEHSWIGWIDNQGKVLRLDQLVFPEVSLETIEDALLVRSN